MTTAETVGAMLPEVIVRCSTRSIEYGELLAKDIPAERFCERPHATINHPAFVYGHLALYPNRVSELLGAPAVIELPEGYAGLFEAGVPCADDSGQHPAKDEIMQLFLDGHRKACEVISTADLAAFGKENPIDRMREVFPTIGIAINFLMNNHLMMHLGQVSSWRRAVGLPSVM